MKENLVKLIRKYIDMIEEIEDNYILTDAIETQLEILNQVVVDLESMLVGLA